MSEFRYTLLPDGGSDRALLPILNWLLRQYPALGVVQPSFADLRGLPRPPRALADRIAAALELFPCDALFVHRDAERSPLDVRVREICRAAAKVSRRQHDALPPYVCVVPVRMQEAWLLFDEAALRRVADNPNGSEFLGLPRLTELEGLPNPKAVLRDCLLRASGLGAHRRRRMHPGAHSWRVSEYAADFAPLRALSAFAALECEVAKLAAEVSRARQS